MVLQWKEFGNVMLFDPRMNGQADEDGQADVFILIRTERNEKELFKPCWVLTYAERMLPLTGESGTLGNRFQISIFPFQQEMKRNFTSRTATTQTEEPDSRKQSANQKVADKPNTGKKQEESKEQGPFFYIGGTNGASLIADFCSNKGWKQISDNNRDDYYFKWSDINPLANHKFHEGKQLLNQIPNNKVLTSKFGLCSSLKDNERIMNKYGRIMFSKFMKLEQFYPETYRMDIKSERYTFYRAFQSGQIWISKPAESSQGKGIFLLKTHDDVKAFLKKLESVEENPYIRMCFCNSPINRIVQRYVDDPLLLEGRKFDVRSYFLIACTSPYMTFFRHGYIKLTCNEYNPDSDDLTDHLTNQFIQKKNAKYSEMKEDTIWSMEHLNDYINEKYMEAKRLPKDWVFTVFTKRMQQIITQCFIASKARLASKLGYFDLLGCDIMIDQNFKVWLLEMNSNPSLQRNCEILKTVIPKVMNEALDLVLEIFRKSSNGMCILPLDTQKEFVLLYNGSPKEPFLKSFKDKLEYKISERATILKRPQHSENRPQLKVVTSIELMTTTDPISIQTRLVPNFTSLIHQGQLPQHLRSARNRSNSDVPSRDHQAGASSDEQSQQKPLQS
ncbi:protein polyglycylase TTLL10-like [Amblyraja radiata]|uniref:protein polyglycylase TTLL10-like n=1 Tax=Amblyraja radiata TaxID=386614 RepID=UPI001404029A|nr:protein polyglycylase TTLL10-like [Amblyraja radiata]